MTPASNCLTSPPSRSEPISVIAPLPRQVVVVFVMDVSALAVAVEDHDELGGAVDGSRWGAGAVEGSSHA